MNQADGASISSGSVSVAAKLTLIEDPCVRGQTALPRRLSTEISIMSGSVLPSILCSFWTLEVDLVCWYRSCTWRRDLIVEELAKDRRLRREDTGARCSFVYDGHILPRV